MKTMFGAVVVLCAVAAAPALAVTPLFAERGLLALAGDYQVQGENPGGEGGYEGTAVITPTGDTYVVEWSIGGQVFVGTGIVSGDQLAVGYDGGTAFYRIGKDGVLQGVWAVTGGDVLGTEVMIPISY